LRWRFNGFSGVRASFQSGILSLIGLAQGVCAEQKTTASQEAILFRKRWIEMLWMAIAAGLIGGASFFWQIYRHLKRARQRDPDIAY
jgi:hypothetical protein